MEESKGILQKTRNQNLSGWGYCSLGCERFTLGAVKEFLDLNEHNDSMFAIMKDGVDGYIVAVLNGSKAVFYQD